MSKSIDSLKPHVKAAWLKAKADLDANFIKCMLTDAGRSDAEQAALFAQGRQALDVVNGLREKAGMPKIGPSENTYTVTKCDGINNKSRHQGGLAVDVVPLDSRGNPYWPVPGSLAWVQIALVMKKYGFKWGGDWTDFKDPPHYEADDMGKL
jgi:peptidoglycan LD-endopeptidase CwlK